MRRTGEKTIYYVSSTDLKDADQYSACTPVKVYNSRSTKMEGCNSHFITGHQYHGDAGR